MITTKRLRLTLLMSFCVVILLASNALATPCSDLAEAKSFSFTLIVESETVISSEEAFSRVLHERHSINCFREILRKGNIQGKMYALVALREIAPSEFQSEMKLLNRTHFPVVVMATKESGILKKEPVQIVLKRIRDGAYRPFFEYERKH